MTLLGYSLSAGNVHWALAEKSSAHPSETTLQRIQPRFRFDNLIVIIACPLWRNFVENSEGKTAFVILSGKTVWRMLESQDAGHIGAHLKLASMVS